MHFAFHLGLSQAQKVIEVVGHEGHAKFFETGRHGGSPHGRPWILNKLQVRQIEAAMVVRPMAGYAQYFFVLSSCQVGYAFSVSVTAGMHLNSSDSVTVLESCQQCQKEKNGGT